MTDFTKPPESELRKRLSRIQYEVTQHEGTEPAFNNEYWNNKNSWHLCGCGIRRTLVQFPG
jgi:peptide methionine sulfoxide reductase MsrB